MLDSIPTYIQANLSFFSILFCAILAAFISYILYRRSVPSLPPVSLLILAMIRGIAVMMILILLFAPEITFIWQRKIPTKISIAVDRSGSMGLDDKIEKANEVKKSLHSSLRTKADLKFYTFDVDTATIENDIITAGNRGTDIASALSKIAQSEFEPDAIIMISDGNFTKGQNPVYNETPDRIKIYTIGVGDTAFAPDLVISDVQVSKVVYQNKTTVIQAELQLYGMSETRSNVILMQGDKKLDIKRVDIDQEGITVPVRFDIKPEKVGTAHYQIVVQALTDEKNRQNNELFFSLNVLKSRLNIGILKQKPDMDPKFMKIILDRYEDFKTHLHIPPYSDLRRTGSPNFRPDSMDVLIFFDAPPGPIREQLLTASRRQRIPVILFIGGPVGKSELAFLQEFAPIKSLQLNQDKTEYLVQRTGTGRLWPVLNNYADDATNNLFWTRCPPIYFPFERIDIDNVGDIVISTREEKPEPVVYRYTKGGLRGVVFFGNGFWRWHFLLAEDRLFRDAWSEKLYNLIRWVTSGSAGGNVVLTTQKQEYQAGEPIRLNVQVYDGALKPVSDATVRLKIENAEQYYEVEAELTENSVYQGKIPSPGTGNHKIEAQAWRNDVNIGVASTEIFVSPVNAEYLSARQDYRLLQTLANVSGGSYATIDSVNNLLTQFDLSPSTRRITRSYELWYRLPVLLTVLMLFAIEWFIRKRKGLA